MIIVPMLVVLALVWRDRGLWPAWELVQRAFDARRIAATRIGPVWLVVAILFMPLVDGTAFAVLRLTGTAVPGPDFTTGEALLVFALYFVGAIPEELGRQAYAYPMLRLARSTLSAALIVGAVWAFWHLIPDALMVRGAMWIFWHLSGTVLLRVIIVWLVVNSGGSIFIAVLFRALLNPSWSLFPVGGSFYDPRVTFAILLVATVGIVARSGSATLIRSR